MVHFMKVNTILLAETLQRWNSSIHFAGKPYSSFLGSSNDTRPRRNQVWYLDPSINDPLITNDNLKLFPLLLKLRGRIWHLACRPFYCITPRPRALSRLQICEWEPEERRISYHLCSSPFVPLRCKAVIIVCHCRSSAMGSLASTVHTHLRFG
jgi:hypothetical protein